MTSPVDFGTQLCEALGLLDPKTISHINIEIPANDVVVVTIEMVFGGRSAEILRHAEADTCADAINLWNSWHKDALTQEQRG